MRSKQKIAVISPLILICLMYPAFRIMAWAFEENWRIGWYLGLIIYWLIWGAIFPWLMIGKESIRRIIRPRNLDTKVFFLLVFPLLMAGLYKFIPGMKYEKPNIWIFLLLITTNFGNGFFEEVLWRGVYMELFPDSNLFRIVWPSIWFALWHCVPGSVSPNGNVLGLMIGAGFLGFYLSFIAKITGTIWWTIIAHTLGGFIMIV